MAARMKKGFKLKKKKVQTTEPPPPAPIPDPIFGVHPDSYTPGGHNGISIYMTDVRYSQDFFAQIGLGDWGELLKRMFYDTNVNKLFAAIPAALPKISKKTPTDALLENPDYTYDDYMRTRQWYGED